MFNIYIIKKIYIFKLRGVTMGVSRQMYKKKKMSFLTNPIHGFSFKLKEFETLFMWHNFI